MLFTLHIPWHAACTVIILLVPLLHSIMFYSIQADIVPQHKVKDVHGAAPGHPNQNMFHPVDFVIPVGPIFAQVAGKLLNICQNQLVWNYLVPSQYTSI